MNQGNELTIPEKIQANAELLIKNIRQDFGIELKYNEEAVRWIEEYIDTHRNTTDQSQVNNLINKMGSFLGECIRHEFGGEWKEVNGQWAIAFNPSNAAFPFNKIAKLFENGLEGGDSILSFYQVIPAVFKNNQLAEARKMLKKKIDSGED